MNEIINPNQWTRLPTTGEKFLGMSRSTIHRFIRAKKIRSSVVTQPGCKTGITYFSAKDVVGLIDRASQPDLNLYA
jgi:hypothetical protein